MAIPAKLKQRINKALPPETVEIEKNMVRRFARAIGEDNPAHFDEDIAEAAGFSGLLAPPTFPAALVHLEDLLVELDLHIEAVMHAEEEYEYFRPICSGDVLTLTHTIVDAYDKQAPGARLVFIVVETRGADAKGRVVFKGRRVMVERKR